MASDILIPIRHESDIVVARREGRQLAAELGLSSGALTVLATAISEVARNIIVYAKHGEIALGVVEEAGKRGVVVIARDQGPGIVDVPRAMQDGYSTSNGLGLGLPGARRLMDKFEIVSQVGKGTTITMTKWAR